MDILKQLFEDHRAFKVVTVISLSIILIGAMVFSSSVVSADDNEEEVPSWSKGYSWEYRESIDMPDPYPDMEAEFELEVVNENGVVNIPDQDGEINSFETYVVEERLYQDDRTRKTEFHYSQDNLAEIYNNPDDDVSSGYAPPVERLNFPLYEGKEWEGDARYFLNPDEEESDPERTYAYTGRVESRVEKSTILGEFDTFMVNLTLVSYDYENGGGAIEEDRRFEMYYSPEVKNLVYTDIYETRYWEEGGEYVERHIGNETLLDYSLEAEEEEETSMIGVWVILAIVGVGTASIIAYKKTKSSY